MNKPEVLAPVGNRAMLEAAVRAGADAVYFGAREFSARRNAENFDLPALREAVAYCHIRGVKCYLALNTLIKEAEFPRAVQLANDAFSAGIDGAIIADLGLVAVLHRLLPDLPLHASTQCSIL
ncbi:MAG: U32 family peptidase, partial [Clostridia bacterium]|nr:U32 family peptidase [Clostridia bacterium]